MPNPASIIRYPAMTTGLVAKISTDPAPARIPYGGAAGGMFFVTAKDASATTITWYAASSPGGPIFAAADAAGNALTTTIVQGKAYEIPGALYGAIEIIPVTNLATATLDINLKS